MPVSDSPKLPRRLAVARLLLAASLSAANLTATAAGLPISEQQRATAERVAQAGVALSELTPNAPESYTVKLGDTLWDISKLFLTSPWRWPELWGMNREQINNPHLIYPGQMLLLVTIDGRARLQLAQARGNEALGTGTGTVKLSPRVRSAALDENSIAAIPLHLIEPFLNAAVVFDTDELASAPRIVVTIDNSFRDEVLAHGDATPEAVANYVRARVREGTITVGAMGTTFEHVRVPAEPTRELRIKVSAGRGARSAIEIRDITPPVVHDPGNETDRWKQTGLLPNGKLLDPLHTQ